MSQSYWLERELGSHRIMYQITKTKYENIVQPYILILLTTGLYVIQIHNESAHYMSSRYTKKITENKNKEKIVQNLRFSYLNSKIFSIILNYYLIIQLSLCDIFLRLRIIVN